MPNKEIKAEVLDFMDGGFGKLKDETFLLSDEDSIAGLGRFISAKACKVMFKNRIETELNNNPEGLNKIGAYEIGRETLLMILGQEGCEAIRVINCVNEENVFSLMAIGIKANGEPVKVESFKNADFSRVRPPSDPIVVEKVGRLSIQKILDELGPVPGQTNQTLSEIIATKLLNIE